MTEPALAWRARTPKDRRKTAAEGPAALSQENHAMRSVAAPGHSRRPVEEVWNVQQQRQPPPPPPPPSPPPQQQQQHHHHQQPSALGRSPSALKPEQLSWLNAAAAGDAGQLETLLDRHSIPVDFPGTDGLGTALHSACSGGHGHVVKWLVRRGAAVDFQNDVGETPLHNAAAGGFQDCVKALLLAGCDTALKDNEGATPRERAKRSGHLKLAALIEYERPKHGARAAHHAPGRKQRRASVELVGMEIVELQRTVSEQELATPRDQLTPEVELQQLRDYKVRVEQLLVRLQGVAERSERARIEQSQQNEVMQVELEKSNSQLAAVREQLALAHQQGEGNTPKDAVAPLVASLMAEQAALSAHALQVEESSAELQEQLQAAHAALGQRDDLLASQKAELAAAAATLQHTASDQAEHISALETQLQAAEQKASATSQHKAELEAALNQQSQAENAGASQSRTAVERLLVEHALMSEHAIRMDREHSQVQADLLAGRDAVEAQSAEMETLQAALAHRAAEAAAHEQTVASHQRTIAGHEQIVADNEQQVAALQQQVSAAHSELAAAKLDQERHASESALQQEMQVVSLRTELAEAHASASAEQQQHTILKSQVADLGASKAELQQVASDHERRCSTLEAELQTATIELTKQKAELEAALNQQSQAENAGASQSRAAVERLLVEHALMSEHAIRMDREHSQVQADLLAGRDAVEAQSAEMETLQAALAQRAAEAVMLSDQLAQSQQFKPPPLEMLTPTRDRGAGSSASSNDGSPRSDSSPRSPTNGSPKKGEKESKKIKRVRQKAKAELAAAHQQHAEAIEAHAQLLVTERESSQQQLMQARQELNNVQQELQLIQSNKDGVAPAAGSPKKAEKDTKRVKRLKQELKESQQQLQALQQQQEQQPVASTITPDEEQRMHQEIEQLRQQSSLFQQQAEQARQELRVEVAAMAELNANVTALQQAIATHQATADADTQRLHEVDAERERLEAALGETQSQLEESQEDTMACMQKIAHFQTEMERLEHAAAEAQASAVAAATAATAVATPPAAPDSELAASLESYKVLLEQAQSPALIQPVDVAEALQIALKQVAKLQSDHRAGRAAMDRWVWVDRCGVTRTSTAVSASTSRPGPEHTHMQAKWAATKGWITDRYRHDYQHPISQHFTVAADVSVDDDDAAVATSASTCVDNGASAVEGQEDTVQQTTWSDASDWISAQYQQSNSFVLERHFARTAAHAVEAAASSRWWADWVWVDRTGVTRSKAKSPADEQARDIRRQQALQSITERYKGTSGDVLPDYIPPSRRGDDTAMATESEYDDGAAAVTSLLLAGAVIRLNDNLRQAGTTATAADGISTGTPVRAESRGKDSSPLVGIEPLGLTPVSVATPSHNLLAEVEKLRDMSRLDSPTMVAHFEEQLTAERAAVEEQKAEVARLRQEMESTAILCDDAAATAARLAETERKAEKQSKQLKKMKKVAKSELAEAQNQHAAAIAAQGQQYEAERASSQRQLLLLQSELQQAQAAQALATAAAAAAPPPTPVQPPAGPAPTPEIEPAAAAPPPATPAFASAPAPQPEPEPKGDAVEESEDKSESQQQPQDATPSTPSTPSGSGGWGLLRAISSPFSAIKAAANPEYKEVNADDMTMYYDEKLKRWVDPNDADSLKPVEAVAPPPTGAAPAPAPALQDAAAGGPGPAGATTPAKVEDTSNDLMAPPPSFRRRKPSQKRQTVSRTMSSPALLSPTSAARAAGTEGAGAAAVLGQNLSTPTPETAAAAAPPVMEFFVPGPAPAAAVAVGEQETATVAATPERPAIFMPPAVGAAAAATADGGGTKPKSKKKKKGATAAAAAAGGDKSSKPKKTKAKKSRDDSTAGPASSSTGATTSAAAAAGVQGGGGGGDGAPKSSRVLARELKKEKKEKKEKKDKKEKKAKKPKSTAADTAAAVYSDPK